MDPNYDPSDFLMAGLPMSSVSVTKHDELKMDMSAEEHDVGIKIHDDLAVSESEGEGDGEGSMNDPHQQVQDEDDGGDLWF